MNHISSYPSIYAIGHRSIANIFSSPVVIEEKVDGSQFSMSRTNGELSCRSKGKDIIIDAPEKMFAQAIEVAKSLGLRDGWVYRGEYLQKPKHNTIAYNRIPKNHVIIFDVTIGPEAYLTPTEKKAEAERIGLECVPCFYDGFTEAKNWNQERTMTKGWAETLLQNDSVLGGTKVEGFVVKNYSIFTADKKIAIAKYVSEAFKEKHVGEWKAANPTPHDVVTNLIASLKTDARWNKAIQHLRDDGKIEGSMRDVGAIIKEIPDDILRDSEGEIKDALFAHFWPQIKRGVTNGFPEFYKKQLGLFTV